MRAPTRTGLRCPPARASGPDSSSRAELLAEARKRRPEHLQDDRLHWWDTTERQGIVEGSEVDVPSASTSGTSLPPWSIGFQMSERYLTWTEDLRGSIVVDFVARELGLSRSQVEERMAQLAVLVPDLSTKFPIMKADLLARLCGDLDAVARRVVELKAAVPGADVGVFVANRPGVLVESVEVVETMRERAEVMRRVFPKVNVDAMLADFPTLLDIEDITAAKEDLASKFGVALEDVDALIGRDPNWLQLTQRGAALIPYDEPAWEANT